MSEKILLHINENENIAALHTVPKDGGAAPQTLVVMLHSFPGHKAGKGGLFEAMAGYLCESGYHTLRFDFRGCGESDGLQESFSLSRASEDLKMALYWAHKDGYKNFIFIGEGLGASIAIQNYTPQATGLALLWPIADTKTYYDYLTHGHLPEGKIKKAGFLELHGYRIGTTLLGELKRCNLMLHMKKVKAPTLILHGSRDKVAPPKEMEIFRKHLGSSHIDITNFHGGDHGLSDAKHRKALMKQVLAFIEKTV